MPDTIVALPLAIGAWTLDAAHSGIYFKVRHLGLSNVRGRFDDFDATLNVGDTLDDVSVSATISLSSVNTNNPDRDAHLRSTDILNVETNPKLEFRSTRITGGGDDYQMEGDLTINGTTKRISFPVDFNGVSVYPMDNSDHAGFTAKTAIHRSDFGVDFNVPLGVDKLALGDKVEIELELQFVAPKGN
jgi:polyisoprenoid-binding protein YceI